LVPDGSGIHYEAAAPAQELASLVARIWQIEASADAESAGRWALPDGHTAWWFVLGDPLLRGRHRIGRGAHVFGMSSRALLSRPLGRLLVVGVVFKPGCAAAVLPVQAHPPGECGTRLRSLWGGDADVLVERLAQAPGFDERKKIVENALRARLRPVDAEVAMAVRHLATDPATRVRSLAVSPAAVRRLERKFRARVGMSPKRLARIFRLQKALLLWSGGQARSWAALAAAAGYADQAHFIREFTEFVGAPPAAFVQRERSMSRSFNTNAGRQKKIGGH